MKVLISIKPQYVEKILSGEKRYEYRRVLFKKEVSTVIVYASSPVKRIIGEFEIADILEESPAILWEKTGDYSGVSREEFFKYFSGKSKGFAIKIGKITVYPEAVDPYSGNTKFFPPQSFRYVEE